jgi:hypothetical protein
MGNPQPGHVQNLSNSVDSMRRKSMIGRNKSGHDTPNTKNVEPIHEINLVDKLKPSVALSRAERVKSDLASPKVSIGDPKQKNNCNERLAPECKRSNVATRSFRQETPKAKVAAFERAMSCARSSTPK